jgi:phage tail-like protein
MAHKPLGPNDVNEYYKLMGSRPEGQVWDMPIYNDANGRPITGPARKAPQRSGNFAAPTYNYQGKPIISNSGSRRNNNNDPVYRVEVYRPGTMPGQLFKAKRYNDYSGKPIISNTIPESGSEKVFRPSEIKKSGIPIPMARMELPNGQGENRKVYLNNNFKVSSLIPIGDFSKISGLEFEWELESYREGGDNNSDHYFPRQIKNSTLVFEYGIGHKDPLWDWLIKANQGMIIKMPLMVSLTNEQKIPVKTWMVLDAMPVKYSVQSFDALASEVAITRLEFIHRGLISVL